MVSRRRRRHTAGARDQAAAFTVHSGTVSARAVLDLRGVRCPLSWARAKVRLENLPRGGELDLLVDDPQGARDIPRAAETAGHHVVCVADGGGTWTITIEV